MRDNKSPAKKEIDFDKIINEMFNSKDKITEVNKQEETKPIDEVTKRWGMNDKLVELFADKIEQEKDLKYKYAVYLIWILIGQLILLNVWFGLKGFAIVQFSDTTFNIFITGGIAEVFLLVRVIVKYLFKDNLSELLKILVKANNNGNNQKQNKLKKENTYRNKEQ
ncbi:MAG: hypothetical protein IJB90_04700 [Clostridia bacterium]|nr:hypothetical protein [Clostridia bacterium]